MRFLVDVSLSWRVAEGLAEAGHEAIHVGDLKLLGAADLRVMEAAASTDRVLISADTDFGELLAVGRHPGPSVIILRRVSHRPEVQTELLLANLDGMEESLAAGAVVVLSAQHVRFRLLPISREE